MNLELIKTVAADAIANWAREHNCPCVLSVENCIVVAKKPTGHDRKYFRHLIITCFAQNAGLTHASWNLVGDELLNLYNKDKICQARQKP